MASHHRNFGIPRPPEPERVPAWVRVRSAFWRCVYWSAIGAMMLLMLAALGLARLAQIADRDADRKPPPCRDGDLPTVEDIAREHGI